MRLTILLAALGGALIAIGADQSSWVSLVLGVIVVIFAVVDAGRPQPPRTPPKNNTERVLRYFGLK